TGCAGGGAGAVVNTPATNNEIDPASSFNPAAWIDLIEAAGAQNPAFYEYAELGRQLVARDKVVLVSPPTLGAGFNAFAWIEEREIWINEPMFTRYPSVIDQATIFLHEMIHIMTGEVTHAGPAWSLQDEFAMFYSDQR
ncbi:MAG: hypothetical protein GX616_23135, partial [Planctomycetes bacterium]|nr:hypothetical protein [Planctomycetota bacterium]